MKRKKIQPKTCYVLGMVAAVPGLVAGVLMALNIGAASLPLIISFVLYGAMVLFLATTSRGKYQASKRIRLLIVFFLLILSYFQLPPISNLAGALVLPLVACWHREDESPLWWRLLLVAELIYATIHTLAITNVLGTSGSIIQGIALSILSILRGCVIFRLYQQAASAPAAPIDEDYKRSLR